jgi:SPP1 family predicted phage head-tail adaptor
MRAGKMDRRITIKTVTESQSATGAPTQTLTTLATVWAQVINESGTEGLEGGTDQANYVRTFRIRWRDDVSAKHLISYDPGSGAELYDIIAINELGRRGGLDIKAVAKVD